MHKRWLPGLVMVMAGLVSGTALGELPLHGDASCRFAVPAQINPYPVSWLGPCAGGFAEGLGVIRAASPAGKTLLFYGRLKHGTPVAGMFGDPDMAGFQSAPAFNSEGAIVDSPDGLNKDTQLYKLAAAAAHAAEQHFARLGNTASAAFYRSQARLFEHGPPE